MPWEKIYDALLEEIKEKIIEDIKEGKGDNKSGKGGGTDCDAKTGQTISDQDLYDAITEELEKMGKRVDEHVTEDVKVDTNHNASASDALTPEEQGKVAAIKNAVEKGYKGHSSSGASAFDRAIMAMPRASDRDWRELLNEELSPSSEVSTSYRRPNKRNNTTNFVFKKRMKAASKNEKVKLGIALDVSGSISNEECKKFLSEVVAIVEQYNHYEIKIWCFHTDIVNPMDFTEHDEFKYIPNGSGGTCFNINWEFMKKEGFVPDTFIMLTDGMCNSFGDPDYCPTVWCVTERNHPDIPHGTVVYCNI